MKETVVVVDGGGRGSALVDKYSQSNHVGRIIAIPGNDLMQTGSQKSVETFPDLKTTDVDEIVEICQKENVALVDVAQDNAVEEGLVDALSKEGIPAVGPTRSAGEIEWNKAFSREFGQNHGLPQPMFKICTSTQEGANFINSQPDQKWFVKAAGLAEGKAALPANDNQEALERIAEMQRFKGAGETFLIERWLVGDDGSAGEEFSTFVFSDGQNFQIIGSAQDHKRAFDNDQGPNTGGMGCSTPPLVLTPELMQEVETKILQKTIKGLFDESRPYKGVLYLGGMAVTQKGMLTPSVVEFNARWGDPEAQVILPGLVNDLFEVSMVIAGGDISKLKIQTDGKSRIVVAGASRGYPGDYSKVRGKQIFGLDQAAKIDGIKVYGAGVKVEDGKHYANGGRLFYVVGEGENIIEAREKAYSAISQVSIEGDNLHYRTDIGYRDVSRYLNDQV